MKQFFNYVKSFFSTQTPIDFDKGKNDESNYFQNKLPKIKENIKENGKFIDPYFSHDIQALIDRFNPILKKKINDDREEEITKYTKNFTNGSYYWERISNILKNINIEEELKKGIAQHGIGDCYLISFLRGCLKFQTEKFYKILGKCHPEIGYWEVNFILENKNIIVFVDDYIALGIDLQPVFAGLRLDNKFAVGIALIIEKAYAKLNGSYLNIRGRNQGGIDPYYHFTGLSTDSKYTSKLSINETYEKIEDNFKKKNIIVCGTKNINNFPIKGIYGNHAYLTTNLEKRNDEKIIELNNPWGYNGKEMKDFNIEMNDIDTKKYIKEFNIRDDNINTGEFKIDLKNFKENWGSIKFIKFKNDKESEKGEKEPLPENIPPGGLDDDDIDDLFKNRVGILDYIGVNGSRQNEFFNSFKNNQELGIFFLFYIFMNYGTTQNNFNALMNGLKNNFNINSFNNQMNQNQFSSLISQTINLIQNLLNNNK